MSDPSLLELIVGPAVVAATVSAAVTMITHWLVGRRDAKARRRELFAEAFAVYAAYREFPYVVRRRRRDKPEEERLRIADELRRVQERLSFFTVWTKIEDSEVGDAYAALVSDLRRVAGAEIRKGWTRDAISSDSDMNIADIDLTALHTLENEFMEVVSRRVGR